MKQDPIFLFLSAKNIEIIESILKNSEYSYEVFANKHKTTSNVLIVDDVCIEENKNLDFSNFSKVICVIPKGYLRFIDLAEKLNNIVFIEHPITYPKLIKELS